MQKKCLITQVHRFLSEPSGLLSSSIAAHAHKIIEPCTGCKAFFSLLLTCLSLTPFSSLAQGNDSLYICGISFNDSASLSLSDIEQLMPASGILSLPPIREIEFRVASHGRLADTLEYKLRGLADDEWSVTTLPVIRYTTLPHKDYVLMVRGKGVEGRSMRFNFAAARAPRANIREEWWFQPLLTFCLLLIPFAVVYFLSLDRSRRNLRIEVVRNQIASDLHDDVGANLGAINNLTDMLKKRHEQQDVEARAGIIDKIKTYTRDTAANLQDTVWAINPLNDSIEELLVRMKDFAYLMLPPKDIQIQYDSEYDPQNPIRLDMQQRHGMLMMFKEAINNIVKHADASAAEIVVHNRNKGQLFIRIKDNGVGFDPGVLHRGNGLKNFRARAGENFVDLDIRSQKGQGVDISMVIHSIH